MSWNQTSLYVCINMSDDIYACDKYAESIDTHLYSIEGKVSLIRLKFLNATESHKVKKGFWCKFFTCMSLHVLLNPSMLVIKAFHGRFW